MACCNSSNPSRRISVKSGRRAFTLLEVMIATAITLIMMISLLQVFKMIGDSMKQGRAELQLNSTLRSVIFRLRHDLSNLTVRVDPPTDLRSGAGYLEIFDGSMTDNTAGLFVSAAENRFGDADDIVMFTARAGDAWFTGQVPQRVLDGTVTVPPNTSTTPVTITSQLAEIIVFARPRKSSLGGGGPLYFDDVDGNLFPDSYQLHYRALLIRPDLNLLGGAGGSMVMNNITVGGDTPTAMADLFQECDLSMHRVYDGVSTIDFVAANSLEDLTNPANRFAHFQYALPGSTASCSMPLLVLESIPQSVFGPFGASSTHMYKDPDPAVAGALLPINHANGNFLDPEYVLDGDRVGVDVLAADVLAFDVKAYDPGAPLIRLFGPNGADDAGADGTDDVILSPNDAGFAAAFASAPVLAGTGDYVDLFWGRKVMSTLPAYSLDFTNISANVGNYFFTPLSGLKGFGSTAAIPPLIFSDGLTKSGKVMVTGTTPPYTILQPVYDTWTSAFESNGTLQSALPGAAIPSVVDVDAFKRLKNSGMSGSDVPSAVPFRTLAPDAGTDGIDNNGSAGVDDIVEHETLPPYPMKLRGIKITIRMEDRGTRQVKQMSLSNEFVTQ